MAQTNDRSAPKKKPKVYTQRSQRIQDAYKRFLDELGVIKKKRDVLTQKIVKRIEQEKIKKILDSIH